jgi:hypothetical protein
MRRRDTLRLLAGGLAAGTALPGGVAAHPTPSDDTEGTPAPTRTDAGYAPLGKVDVEGATETVVSADGTTAFVAATTGYAIVDISVPSEPTILAERRDLQADHEDGPLPQIHDVKQEGDTLLVVGPANRLGGEYLSGMLVVDVSDPETPEHRAFYGTDHPIHNCYLDGDRAYLTANAREIRLEILDMAGEEPTSLGSWSLEEHDRAWDNAPWSVRVLHDVWVQDDVAYLAHWDAGVWLLDVSDPASPTVLTHIGERSAGAVLSDAEQRIPSEQQSLPGNAHFVTVDEAGDLLAVGREAWATRDAPPDGGTETGTATETDPYGGGPGGIDLFDVSDPEAPEKLTTIDPPPTADPTIRGLWTTAHNCELRDGVLYSSWYRGGVKRHDVSDPANPTQLTWWADPPHAEFWTAQVGVAGTTFVGSSRGTGTSSAGLYVFPDESGTTTWGFEDVVGDTATESATETESPTATPTATATQIPTSTPAAQSTTADGPGMGLLATLAALGVGALGWGRTRGGASDGADDE